MEPSICLNDESFVSNKQKGNFGGNKGMKRTESNSNLSGSKGGSASNTPMSTPGSQRRDTRVFFFFFVVNCRTDQIGELIQRRSYDLVELVFQPRYHLMLLLYQLQKTDGSQAEISK